jgi:glutathione S-transferase
MKTNGSVRDFCYSHKDPTEEDRKQILGGFSYPLGRIEALLASRKFHLGDQLTGADLYLYETFRMMEIVHKETAHSYPNIKRVADSIEDFDWFKAYKASPRWFSQLNGDEAYINNKQ